MHKTSNLPPRSGGFPAMGIPVALGMLAGLAAAAPAQAEGTFDASSIRTDLRLEYADSLEGLSTPYRWAMIPMRNEKPVTYDWHVGNLQGDRRTVRIVVALGAPLVRNLQGAYGAGRSGTITIQLRSQFSTPASIEYAE